MGGSLRAGSDHLQYTALRRLFTCLLEQVRKAWVRSVFNMILFPYLFDEKFETKREPLFSTGKCESLLSTFATPLSKWSKRSQEWLLIPVFDLFHPCLARCHLCWRKGLNLVENEEGPRIFLSTVLLEAPLSPLKKQGPVSLGLGEDRDKE